jgi:hypothetical protein
VEQTQKLTQNLAKVQPQKLLLIQDPHFQTMNLVIQIHIPLQRVEVAVVAQIRLPTVLLWKNYVRMREENATKSETPPMNPGTANV